ncbi:hypothetical protein BsWGS_11024 [Bradybaena similaris]
MACVHSPIPVPYKQTICGGLSVGAAVRVRLFVHQDASSFVINFNCGAGGCTTALHFKASQSEQTVTLNTKESVWKQEVKVPESFKFHRNQYFHLVFVASDGCFEIYENGRFLTSYKYQIEVEKIDNLEIDGGIVLMDVEIKKRMADDYRKTLPKSMEIGDIVAVKGFFYPGCNRFVINLINGTCGTEDIALVFNPRRSLGTIVLNSMQHGRWGTEDRHQMTGEWTTKTLFQVEISFTGTVFKIYIDGRWFANFTVKGQVDIRSINVKGDAYFHDIQLLKKVDNKFVDKLPAKLELGAWISISGTAEPCDKEFHINLQIGDGCGHDVALNFNPSFTEKCKILNSVIAGSRGKEEKKQTEFPFEPEDRFELLFLRLCAVFKIIVNRTFYIDFTHRVDPSHVSHVQVAGDCDFYKPEY